MKLLVTCRSLTLTSSRPPICSQDTGESSVLPRLPRKQEGSTTFSASWKCFIPMVCSLKYCGKTREHLMDGAACKLRWAYKFPQRKRLHCVFKDVLTLLSSLMAFIAASRQRALRSAPTYPVVCCASSAMSTLGQTGIPPHRTVKMAFLCCRVGGPMIT